MSTIAQLVVEVDSRQVKDGKVDLLDYAKAGGVAEQATDKLADASREAAKAANENKRAVEELEDRIRALKSSVDPFHASLSKVNDELREASSLYKLGAISQTDFSSAMRILEDRQSNLLRAQGKLNEAHRTGAAGAKLQGYELINLARQAGDVGTMAGLGASGMAILISQGPQVAEIFGVAAERGVTLKTALGQIGGLAIDTAKKFAPLLGLGVGLAAVGFAAYSVAQEIGKTNKAVKELEATIAAAKSEITNADDALKSASLGALQLGEQSLASAHGIKAFAGEIGDAAKKLYDFAAASKTATVNGLMAQRAALAARSTALEQRSVEGRRGALEGDWTPQNIWGHLTRRVGGDLQSLWTGGDSDRDIANRLGDAQKTMRDLDDMIRRAMDSDLSSFADEGHAALGDKLKNKKAPRQKQDPRDQTDERTAQVDGLIAAAAAEELQARIAAAREAGERADLAKQVLQAEYAQQQASLARHAANIEDDKGLSRATKDELIGRLSLVAQTNERVMSAKAEKIDQDRNIALAKEASDLLAAANDNQTELLQAQLEVTQFAYQRRPIEQKIIALKFAEERRLLEAVSLANGANESQVAAAKARLAILGQLESLAQARVIGTTQDAFEDVNRALDDMASAFDRKDWAAVVDNLFEAIRALRNASSTSATKIGGLAGLASFAGNLVGGKAGAGLTGAASGAMGGLSAVAGLGSLGLAVSGPVGWGIAGVGALLGGLGGLFGGNSRKKEEERRRQEEITNGLLQQRVELLRAEGKETEARNLERQNALSKMAPELRAGQQAAWNAQDSRAIQSEGTSITRRIQELDDQLAGTNTALVEARKAEIEAADPLNRYLVEILHARQDEIAALEKQRLLTDARADLELRIFEATGQAAEALAFRRRKEREEAVKLDPALGALVDTLHQAEDAAQLVAEANRRKEEAEARVSEARNALQEAYDREASSLQGVIDKFKGFATALGQFRRQLTITNEFAAPEDRYNTARSEFLRVSRLAAQGNEDALGDLQDVSQAYLDASKDYSRDALMYLSDLADVKNAVKMAEDYALQQVDNAVIELDLLKKQVDHLLEIRDGILTIPDAIAALEAAIASAVNDNGGGGTDPNPASGLVSGGRFEGFTKSELYEWQNYADGSRDPSAMPWPQYQAYLMLQQLKSAGYTVPGFAAGGSHAGGLRLVGERGPELEFTGPSRIMNAEMTQRVFSGGGQSYSELVAEVRRLNAIVERMAMDLAGGQTANTAYSRKSWEVLDKLDRMGIKERAA